MSLEFVRLNKVICFILLEGIRLTTTFWSNTTGITRRLNRLFNRTITLCQTLLDKYIVEVGSLKDKSQTWRIRDHVQKHMWLCVVGETAYSEVVETEKHQIDIY